LSKIDAGRALEKPDPWLPVAILDAAPDGIVVFDDSGRIVFVNFQVAAMFGYERQALIGKPVKDLLPPSLWEGEDLHLPRRNCSPQLSQPLDQWAELTGRTQAGEAIPFEILLSPVDRVDEEPMTMATVRGVGERHKLLERARRLSALVDASDAAIYGLDLDGRFQSWSKGAEAMFGYNFADVEGQSVNMLIPPELQELRANETEKIVRGERVPLHRTRRIRKDGTELWVSVAVSPLKRTDAHVEGLSVTARDITQVVSLETQLRQSQKMEAVGQLTGGIAHDFNNLLTVMRGNLQMLERRFRNDPSNSPLIETASRAVDRGADLTQRLLAFSRRQSLEPKVIDINTRLSDMDMLLRRTLGERIHLRTAVSPGVQMVRVDPAQLETAVLNLALNARDAMPEGGRLTIETAVTEFDERYTATHTYITAGRYSMLAVSDTGTGIAREDLDRVFEPFFTTKDTGKGTGLGLSMVYGFIKQSGGCVNVYSEPGRGTTVKLYLPVTEDAAPIVEEPRAIQEPCEALVLLVEDQEDVRRTVSMMLRDLGYLVLEADSGASAIEVLKSEPEIEVLFTDVVMPGALTGVDLAREARRMRPNLKVLYTSGYAEKAFDDGIEEAVALLSKPYAQEDLAERLRDLLAS
jgi:PAS domain S-box-containing protein